MKKFKDLVFERRDDPFGGHASLLEFDNGYSVSVIYGGSSYSTTGTYELAVLKDNAVCYDTPITDDVLGHQSKAEVTAIMAKVQKL